MGSNPIKVHNIDNKDFFLSSSGLFPHIFNLATRARITTNATCGERQPEMYCRLVEHVPMGEMQMEPDHAQCQLCDVYSQDPTQRHWIYNAIDGTNSWWQSPTLANGKHYHWVTITLDLQQVFNIAYIIVKAANAPRPGNWILEHSIDGINFNPWQYYAISDVECLRLYGIAPAIGMHRFIRDDEVICTSYYSQLEPLSNGEIHTSIVNGRPSRRNPSETLMKFMAARFVRLRFQKIRTLHGGLMAYGKNGFIDENVHRRYFYSIKDISIGGQCICFGHASSCIQDPEVAPDQPVLKCVCEHNTCGESCNECCQGFVQKTWKPGSRDQSNECEPCNCHGHSDTCYYDEAVDMAHQSLDIHGNYEGGGVCVGCRDGTTGINCEMCVDGTYRPLGIETNDPQPCVPCDCSVVGTRRDDTTNRLLVCAKDESRMYEGLNPGDCFCKPGYAGQRCDQCARGYFGYPYCQPCQCNLAGSRNPDACEGPCDCKENVIGQSCDQCKSGYFNLNEEDEAGCTRCFCFGLSTVCESIPWGIEKIRDMNDWIVTNQETSAYVTPRIAGPNMIAINHLEARKQLQADNYFWRAPRPYLGNKLTAYGGRLQFAVSYKDQPGKQADPTTDIDVIMEGNGISIYKNSLVVMPDTKETVVITMTERDWHRLAPNTDLGEGSRGQPATQADFMSVLSGLEKLMIRAVYSSGVVESRLSDVSLETASEEATDPGIFASIEQCTCPASYEGLSCESCEIGYRRVDGVLLNGICEPCHCNNHATECSDFTAECFDCAHNTTGPHCEFCAIGFYGYSVQGTIRDCQPCACPLQNPENNFSPTCVSDPKFGYVCDSCPSGFTGPRCERCADGFYGNPMEDGGYCRPCAPLCNNNINPDIPASCDTLTGECLICIGDTCGSHCEHCRDGYFGDAIKAKNCQECRCDEDGAISSFCDRETGQCECKPNVIGLSCDQCAPGFWNLESLLGCQSCDCNPVGSLDDTCDVMTGQCRCKPGVTGMRCDECELGYWNLSETGCQACDCEFSVWCNPVNGQCSCPPNTVGQRCESCADDHWGYDIHTGCKPCNCSAEGSSRSDCDPTNGQCSCKRKFVGRRCDECPFGYRDYPRCKRCKCDEVGTDPTSCQNGMCQCADDSQCACKANVRGKKCDKCINKSFSLRATLPEGCTSCFCFGITDNCRQTDLVRKDLRMSSRTNDFSVSDVFYSVPTQRGVTFTTERVDLNATEAFLTLNVDELYWNLPIAFVGNKVSSYGGNLSFTLAYRLKPPSISPVDSTVDIKILGVRYAVTLDTPELLPDVKQAFSIKLLEHNFQLQPFGRQPTREEFMMVLQDIRAILIRATYGPDTVYSLIDDVVLETAGPVRGDISGDPAIGVEQCDCPTGYTGLSCERCDSGYFRLSGGDYLGTCVPCVCFGHSDICDDRTGLCEDCQHNTTGQQCNICDVGFYGDATGGTPSDCMQCACPSLDPAYNFSPTCILDPLDGQHRCTDCQTSYFGRYCDSCDDGHYGDPTTPGGTCQPCDCNTYGSISSVCDKTTGDCLCVEGITGENCDQCDEGSGYVVTETGCSSCYGNCTGLLLTELDRLEQLLQERNFSNIVVAPWEKLREMENATKLIKKRIEMQLEALNITRELLQDLPDASSLQEDADSLEMRANSTMINATLLRNKAERTTLRALDAEANITAIFDRIKDIVGEISNIREELGKELSLDESTALLVEARQIVMDISDRDNLFMYSQLGADVELGEANKTLDKARNFFDDILDLQPMIDRGRSAIGNFTKQLEFLIETSRKATNQSGNATNINQGSNTLMDLIQNITTQTEDLKETSKGKLTEAHEFIDKAWDLLALANASGVGLREEFALLSNVTSDLGFKVGIIQQNSFGLDELVQRAEAHAEKLKGQAQHLQELFQPTKDYAEDSIRAVNAYGQILLAIDEAEQAAGQAMVAANNASYQVSHPEPLDILALLSLEKSLSLDTNNLFPRLEELEAMLDGVRNDITMVTEKNDDAEKRLRAIQEALPPLKIDLTTPAQEALDLSMLALNKAENVGNRIGGISRQLPEMEKKIEQLKEDVRFVDDALEIVGNATRYSRSSVNQIRRLSSSLNGQANDMKALEGDMAVDLSKIREKIRQARNQASKIKVSMYSTGDCARSYKPQVSPSTYNSLIMNVNITSPTNLLFYIKSNSSDEFMLLETINGKPFFRWNVGADVGSIKSSEVMQLKEWYRIEAQRIGHAGSLKVQKLISEEDNSNPENTMEPPVVLTGMSAVGSSILDVDSSSLMFVGGIPRKYDSVVQGVESREFRGCMGEVILDDVPVGLWNFKSIEGQCQGCGNSPSTSVVEEGVYNFDGTGYSLIPRPSKGEWRENTISIAFQLKTQAEEALLFYMASSDQRDYMAIELIDGYMVVSHDLGSGTGKVSSRERVNTNTWISVSVIRNRGNSIFYIDNVWQGNGVSAGTLTGLTIEEFAYLHVGGVQSFYNVRRDVTTQPFYGCIKFFGLYGNQQNLLQPGLSTGVEDGCVKRTVRSLGLLEGAQVKMRNIALGKIADVSLTFTTAQETGILLAAGKMVEDRTRRDVDPDQTDVSYAVALVAGRIRVHINAGQGLLTLTTRSSAGVFNDGRPHVVLLQKEDFSIRLIVDDVIARSGRLPGSESLIPVTSPLYIGSVPASVRLGPGLQEMRPLVGCVKDLVIMGSLVGFESASSFSNATIGKCSIVTPIPPSDITKESTDPPVLHDSPATPGDVENITEPSTSTTFSPMGCALAREPSAIANAVRFGLSMDSHIQIAIDPLQFGKVFSVNVELRTSSQEGMIFFLGSDSNPDIYCSVHLKMGYVFFTFSSGLKNGNRNVLSHHAIDDGQWHVVKVLKNRKTISLTLDAHETQKEKFSRRVNMVDFDSPLYVGGAPSTDTRTIDGIAMRSFEGCIRKISVNQDEMDLMQPQISNRVTPCFMSTEPGAYFRGTGYAILNEPVAMDVDFVLSFKFRTAQQFAVLLSIQDNKDGGLALEIINRELVLRVDNNLNGPRRITFNGATQDIALCDNQFHMVHVLQQGSELRLFVDDDNFEYNGDDGATAETNGTISVGGFPEPMWQHSGTIKTAFNGCIQDFRINLGRPYIFLSASESIDVIPDQCPLT
ncbi:laminin subunit alpha-2-like [Patiria miniata]|uniref:Laminin subunit alpha-2 n=1 Tax=Patiria miniata TaxID=46514 RepID=A0A913ZX54_PATMI|nr:laminin subunit alpha-2-like [Patiria miniata]